jgi:uncharacterized protein with HEPN domain
MDARGLVYDEFGNSELLQSAVIRQLEIMGEATQRLPSSFLSQYPDVLPWRAMKGMRNMLIHGYDQVNLEMVWKTITRDIPRVRQTLRAFIPAYALRREHDRQLDD